MGDQVAVGQAWRDNDRRECGQRVVVLTDVGGGYVYGRSETPPHRRTRIGRDVLTSRFTLCGEMDLTRPERWPHWFREDVDPRRFDPSTSTKEVETSE